MTGWHHEQVEFEGELARILPADIPNRDVVIAKSAAHLRLVAVANEYMNLTRITSPTEAAIKHVYDSLAPWRRFAEAQRVLDAGTGAGFPGVPLALALPQVRFTLSESTQKKARFVESAVASLELKNVEVTSERAEDVAAHHAFQIITARAVAPAARLLDLFGKALGGGARLLLFKGPEVDAELKEVTGSRWRAAILERYQLPENYGLRTLVEVQASSAKRETIQRQAGAIQG